MKFIRENTKFLFILVIPVYFYIVQSSILNEHSHFNSNGLVITHSHPLAEEADNHNHSETEICFFASLHIDFYTFSPEINVSPNETLFSQKFIIRDDSCTYLSVSLYKKLRGPPVFQIV